jgi:hypothetical protein
MRFERSITYNAEREIPGSIGGAIIGTNCFLDRLSGAVAAYLGHLTAMSLTNLDLGDSSAVGPCIVALKSEKRQY